MTNQTDDLDDTEPVYGESYDHDLNLISEADGIRTYECRECGAEKSKKRTRRTSERR